MAPTANTCLFCHKILVLIQVCGSKYCAVFDNVFDCIFLMQSGYLSVKTQMCQKQANRSKWRLWEL